ncbi:hypothetical protein SDC9_208397 [bioreactor metagenome]|uniref:Uncharacterized protein n=1 Tax=bioreactor metagenome TaxID=1076179 RepID=A0A645JB68_9ZZZZ
MLPQRKAFGKSLSYFFSGKVGIREDNDSSFGICLFDARKGFLRDSKAVGGDSFRFHRPFYRRFVIPAFHDNDFLYHNDLLLRRLSVNLARSPRRWLFSLSLYLYRGAHIKSLPV